MQQFSSNAQQKLEKILLVKTYSRFTQEIGFEKEDVQKHTYKILKIDLYHQCMQKALPPAVFMNNDISAQVRYVIL